MGTRRWGYMLSSSDNFSVGREVSQSSSREARHHTCCLSRSDRRGRGLLIALHGCFLSRTPLTQPS